MLTSAHIIPNTTDFVLYILFQKNNIYIFFFLVYLRCTIQKQFITVSCLSSNDRRGGKVERKGYVTAKLIEIGG
jgi:hypothetical protein